MQLADLEYAYIAAELNERLSGARVGKAYQITESLFKLQFTGKSGKHTLVVQLPDYLTLTARDIPSPQQPSNFVMALRKRIENAVVEGVSQPDAERIIVISLDCKGQKCRLVLEMFSSGNIIFCVGDEIDLVYRRESWRGRELRKGVKYVPPPSKVPPLAARGSQLSLNGKATLISGIMSVVALAPKYLEEALSRAGIDPKSREEPSPEQKERLLSAIREVCTEKRYLAYMEGNEVRDCSVCALSKYAGLAQKEFSSVCELVDYACIPSLEAKQDSVSIRKKEVAEQVMRARLAELEAEAVQCRQAGDWIYAHYEDVGRMLDTASKMHRQHKSDDEISSELSKIFPGARFKGGKIILETS
ncbi:MAG: NFACT family protein [Candidatus Micrarchaeota archaeon]|nr:NFACT family protein [Candidatus Micrarchaeota archaeon]